MAAAGATGAATTLLGVRVMANVSRNIVMLASDGSIDGTKAACAAEFGTRVVHPDEFEVLLMNVQPAKPKARRIGLLQP
jgi:DNA polymerase III subunit epsilon